MHGIQCTNWLKNTITCWNLESQLYFEFVCFCYCSDSFDVNSVSAPKQNSLSSVSCLSLVFDLTLLIGLYLEDWEAADFSRAVGWSNDSLPCLGVRPYPRPNAVTVHAGTSLVVGHFHTLSWETSFENICHIHLLEPLSLIYLLCSTERALIG